MKIQLNELAKANEIKIAQHVQQSATSGFATQKEGLSKGLCSQGGVVKHIILSDTNKNALAHMHIDTGEKEGETQLQTHTHTHTHIHENIAACRFSHNLENTQKMYINY